MHCPQCGILIEDKWNFCPKCNNDLKGLNADKQPLQLKEENINYTTITSNKSRKEAMNFCFTGIALVIMAVVFHLPLLAVIGGGLHRFYVGKVVSGAFYAITGGFAGIGLILDLIQLNIGQFTDNVGQPLRK